MIPVGLLSPGEHGEIVAIRDGGGAILLKVDESRLAVGRGMAMKIMVRR